MKIKKTCENCKWAIFNGSTTSMGCPQYRCYYSPVEVLKVGDDFCSFFKWDKIKNSNQTTDKYKQ